MTTAELPEQPPVEQPDHLDFLRGQVDILDQEIVELAERRTALALAIDAEKKARGMSTITADRGNETIALYMNSVREDGPLDKGDAVKLGMDVVQLCIEARRRRDRDKAPGADEPGARLQRAAEAAGEI